MLETAEAHLILLKCNEQTQTLIFKQNGEGWRIQQNQEHFNTAAT